MRGVFLAYAKNTRDWFCQGSHLGELHGGAFCTEYVWLGRGLVRVVVFSA